MADNGKDKTSEQNSSTGECSNDVADMESTGNDLCPENLASNKSDDNDIPKEEVADCSSSQGQNDDALLTRKKKKFKKTMNITSSNSSAADSGLPTSSNTSNEADAIELASASESSSSSSTCSSSSSTSTSSNFDFNSFPDEISSTMRAQFANESILDNSSDSDDLLRSVSLDPETCDPDEDESNICFLADKFTKPKYKWHVSKEVINRKFGMPSLKSSDMFRMRFHGSLHAVERLELMYKMERHQGCVNTLNFNSTGTKLASGSDDLNIIIWDWTIGEPMLVFESGHRANVFQSKFLPLSGDCHIVSCARDGQVRLAELSSDGSCKGTRKIAYHRGSAHKLTIEPSSAQIVLSCGEDANVFEIDLRESKSRRLVTCKSDESKVPLYAIHAHPMKDSQFIVGGLDHFVRVYDKRFIGDDNKILKKISPNHLRDSNISANITCCVYNHDGSEILASYNDEDIYLFDSEMPEYGSYKHRYQGHRNYKTVKGVNFFGPESQYVVSGSDCGNIYYWEKCSSRIVQCMMGDVGGVVNCLEPHPNLPVMASSGLDDDIKIWVPSHEKPPDLSKFREVVIKNCKKRVLDRKERVHNYDSRMFWFIVNSLRTRGHGRGGPTEDDPSTDRENITSSEDGTDDDDDQDASRDARYNSQCVQS